jgi:hypothetical protein
MSTQNNKYRGYRLIFFKYHTSATWCRLRQGFTFLRRLFAGAAAAALILTAELCKTFLCCAKLLPCGFTALSLVHLSSGLGRRRRIFRIYRRRLAHGWQRHWAKWLHYIALHRKQASLAAVSLWHLRSVLHFSSAVHPSENFTLVGAWLTGSLAWRGCHCGGGGCCVVGLRLCIHRCDHRHAQEQMQSFHG